MSRERPQRHGGVSGAVLTVDLAALKSNYRLLRDKSTTARCAAVVKANAYGTGIERVAPALRDAGCRVFFVATVDEAAALRGIVGPDPGIFVLNGLPAGAGGAFEACGLTPVLNDLGQIERWSERARTAGRALPAAIHFDTGMSRLGLPEDETRRLMDDPAAIEGLDVACVMSHLVSSEEPGNPLNGRQLEAFSAIRAGFPGIAASLANSSGVFLGPEYHFDLMRPGVALYGANPRPGHPNPMREVVRLTAKIAQVRRIDAPRTVGYGAAHRVSGPTAIATLPVGYADGYLRSLSGRGFCFLGGFRVPVVGRVSMDLVTLDVSSVPPGLVFPGAEVDVIGGPVPIDDLAEAGGTIAYELLTALGARYRRDYVSGTDGE